jgi:hypothetical protein
VPVLSAAEYYLAFGRPFFRAQALEDAAALEAERGELAAAERYLGEALGLYTAMSAAWDVEHAGARLQRYGIGPVRVAFRRRPATRWRR